MQFSKLFSDVKKREGWRKEIPKLENKISCLVSSEIPCVCRFPYSPEESVWSGHSKIKERDAQKSKMAEIPESLLMVLEITRFPQAWHFLLFLCG